MLYEDALVKVNGELMRGRIEIHKGNYVYDSKLYEKYYHFFNEENFRYLGSIDEIIDNDLPKCKVLIQVKREDISLIVIGKNGEKLLYCIAKKVTNNA